jgi:hypothetical protein
MLMSVLGGMSESERQHVQARVRAAMDAQVINEGRHQGGRAPYGYVVIDGGPHPNPRKASEGFRLRLLAIDEPSAEVVRRIFAEYLDGAGDRAIANGLNRDAIPCPSALRPEQNRHRLADGWQGSTVRAILENPRYTGYAVFGRWTKHEVLLNPDDVAAGHVVRFKRAESSSVVRSRTQAHPAIVSVETFTQAQLLRRSKGAGGLRTARKSERSGRPTVRPYLFRGRIRCAVCKRKMEASPRKHGMYYRCPARTLAPGSPVLASHPPAVYLREDPVREAVNDWLSGVFAPENVDRTVAALVGSQGDERGSHEAVKARLTNAEAKMRRLQAAIEAGVDPVALVESINEAQAERTALRAELDNLPTGNMRSDAEIYARIDTLAELGTGLSRSNPDRLASFYTAVDLRVCYDHETGAADVTIEPLLRVNSECVRGGMNPHTGEISPIRGHHPKDDSSEALSLSCHHSRLVVSHPNRCLCRSTPESGIYPQSGEAGWPTLAHARDRNLVSRCEAYEW